MAKKMLTPLKPPPTKPHLPVLLPVRFERWVVPPPPEPPPLLECSSDLLETGIPSVGYSGETLPGLLGLGNLRFSLPFSMGSGEIPTCVVPSFGQTIQTQVTSSYLQRMLLRFTLHPGLVAPIWLFTEFGDCSLNQTPGDCSSTAPSWFAEPTRRLLLTNPSPRKPYKLWAWPSRRGGPPNPNMPSPSSPNLLQIWARFVASSDPPPDRGCPPPPSSSTLQWPPPYA